MINERGKHNAFLPSSDPQYRLPQRAHERLCDVLNVTAFEALLARLKPEPRNELLEVTLELASRGKIAFGPMFSELIDDVEITELFADVARRPPA